MVVRKRVVENRLRRRIHLLEARRQHLLRQLALRLRDGGLYVLRGGVDVPARARTGARSRCSPWVLVDVIVSIPGMVENSFSSGVATAEAMVSGLAPGQAGAHRDRGVVHRGQVAHRQLPVGHQAEDQNAGHDQRGHDRPPDEELGIHRTPSLRAVSAAALIWTLEPWRRRSWPSITTRSPGCTLTGHDGEVTRGPVHCHRLGGRGAVRLNHEHEASLLSRDHRRGGDHQRIALDVQLQPHVDELAGPERAVVVGKVALEQDRAGGGIDRVVHEAQGALARIASTRTVRPAPRASRPGCAG